MIANRQAGALSALCTVTGVLHLTRPEPYDRLIPPVLPGSPRAWTYGSGVAELVVAGLLAAPETRRAGGYAAAALFVGVFPGNLQMAWDWRHRGRARRVISIGRLPLQADLISRAMVVARPAGQTRR